MLLSLFEKFSQTSEKYTKIATLLNNVEGCHCRNKIFISDSHLDSDVLRQTNFADIETADFSKNSNAFTNYMNKFGRLQYHEFSSKTQIIYANACSIERSWHPKIFTGTGVRLYNSFDYTNDIKYAGRLLEMPLKSDFKLVLILPNYEDGLETLFFTLTEYGLGAAIKTIRPLFTATSGPLPLNIDFSCRVQIKHRHKVVEYGSTVQYGSIAVSELGTKVKVLTCLYSPTDTLMKVDDIVAVTDSTAPQPPFYFAVLHKDTTIFIGDFNRKLLPKTNK